MVLKILVNAVLLQLVNLVFLLLVNVALQLLLNLYLLLLVIFCLNCLELGGSQSSLEYGAPASDECGASTAGEYVVLRLHAEYIV